MRTRRSWKNQERLFKALFKSKEKEAAPVDRVELLTEALKDPFISSRTRGMIQRDLEKALVKKALAKAEARP